MEREPISYETETEYTTDLAFGVQRILQEGVEGQKDVTYETTYVGGQVNRAQGRGRAGGDHRAR